MVHYIYTTYEGNNGFFIVFFFFTCFLGVKLLRTKNKNKRQFLDERFKRSSSRWTKKEPLKYEVHTYLAVVVEAYCVFKEIYENKREV